ncbi:MAG TPA: prenyltransferase/squalene oxidase repeat-containing protein [Terriglobia bacterium]|nr:prenyltransferase/squalene oxidase repeat-containing protein [Terriglobia bacterium]
MRFDRRVFICLAAGLAGCARLSARTPLSRAVDYLWGQQADDGGFHSATYGLLRSGQSLTPFALSMLLDVPASVAPRPQSAVERAFAFIRKNTDANGALGLMDETVADYPNYATSLAVIAFSKARLGNWQEEIQPMVAQLRSQQYAEANGWKESDAAFGAWGMGGPILRPPEAGHVDLSMTRCVLEALRAAGVPPDDPAISRSLTYLARSQNADGGFYFSAVNADINKAGEVDGGFKSYGTATADGILALRAAGVPDTDSRIARAVKWLRDRHQPDRAPGFDPGPRESWASGLRFYYAGVITRALPDLAIALPEQAEDGSFRNSNPLVKEDDPLIATTFAIGVLLRSA